MSKEFVMSASSLAVLIMVGFIAVNYYPSKADAQSIAEKEVSKQLKPIENRLDKIDNKLDTLLLRKN